MFVLSTDFWFAVIRSMTPMIFATMAISIAAKSGVVNIAVEGTMLMAALTGVVISAYTKSLLLGMLSGMAIGVCSALLLGFFIMRMKANPIVTGIAINLAALGGTTFVLYVLTGDKSISSSLSSCVFPNWEIPLIKNIPVVGDILSGHSCLTYIAIIVVVLLSILLKKCPLGLKIRAVGENQAASEAVGINTNRIKVIALAMSGLIASLGGMFLSMSYLSMFTANMTAGRGYMAMATDAMAASNPFGGFVASFIYGFADSLAIYMQQSNIPPEFVRMFPYLFIIVICSVFSFVRRKKNKEVSPF